MLKIDREVIFLMENGDLYGLFRYLIWKEEEARAVAAEEDEDEDEEDENEDDEEHEN